MTHLGLGDKKETNLCCVKSLKYWTVCYSSEPTLIHKGIARCHHPIYFTFWKILLRWERFLSYRNPIIHLTVYFLRIVRCEYLWDENYEHLCYRTRSSSLLLYETALNIFEDHLINPANVSSNFYSFFTRKLMFFHFSYH